MNKLLVATLCIVMLPVLAFAEITPSDVADKMKVGDVKTAEMLTRQILKDHPESPKAHYYLGQILATEGNYKGAYAELNKAADLDKTLTFAASPERFRQEMDKVKVNLGRAEAPPISDVKDTGWGWFTWLLILSIGGGAVWFFFFRNPEEKKTEEGDNHPARNHPSYASSRPQPSSYSHSRQPYQTSAPNTAPQQQQSAAAPHIVNNYNSNDGGLVEGMIIGSMLGSRNSNTTNNNTIIEKETVIEKNDSFDEGSSKNSSDSNFDSGSNSSSGSDFDSGSDSSSSFDSGSSSFDSGGSSFDS